MRNKLIKFCYSIYWIMLSGLWVFTRTRKERCTNKLFSIGVTTYINRYDIFFKPLIKALIKAFPDTRIIVAVNGYHTSDKQNLYLLKINAFLSRYPNIKVVDYVEAQSLSKLWNQLIIQSNTDKTIILNDDLKISPWFRKSLENSGILNEDVALINRSWSHFIIDKKIIQQIGWFDERFPALGNEDEDYEARLTIANKHVHSYKLKHVYNVVFVNKDFSYGKNVELVNIKYARVNKLFFDQKWTFSKSEKIGYTYVPILNGYVKLVEGMETPNFYLNI